MKATATKKKVSYAKWGYLFILPFFLVFLVFQLVPLVSTFYYSFFEYYRDGLTVVGPNFVGLKNYQELLSADLPKYIGNTTSCAVGSSTDYCIAGSGSMVYGCKTSGSKERHFLKL